MANTPKRKAREKNNSSDRDSETAFPADKRKKDEDFSIGSEDVFTRGFSNMPETDDMAANIKYILQKLEKLDSMETMLNKALSKIEAVETQVNEFALKVEALDSKRRVADKSLGKLTASVEFALGVCDDVKSDQKKDRENNYEAKFARMSKEMSYMEAYSKRENLLFKGIQEVPGENEREDTGAILRSFMKVEEPDAIEFQRVHRLGNDTSKGRRIIIARFLRYSDRQ
ncbi:hypothetical protein OS493_007107 [Desmophyllum pertusum]|uniref:Uncharacterized protein n=1 Tax=Desmophyllum pertusum TaxID=174260 RepID=A0A9W9ZGS9_9CNID|nr:hypothetical protein OS493_007107 [Desmophyllum pertusum]